MDNLKQTNLNNEEVSVDGTSLYVYYDFALSQGTDFGVQPSYDITVRQCFDLRGTPAEVTPEQTKQIEAILNERIKLGNGKAGF